MVMLLIWFGTCLTFQGFAWTYFIQLHGVSTFLHHFSNPSIVQYLWYVLSKSLEMIYVVLLLSFSCIFFAHFLGSYIFKHNQAVLALAFKYCTVCESRELLHVEINSYISVIINSHYDKIVGVLFIGEWAITRLALENMCIWVWSISNSV